MREPALVLCLLWAVPSIVNCFTRTSIEFDATQTEADIQAPVAFTVNFTLGWDIQGSEAVIIKLLVSRED